jgi:hypothetical protein
MKTEGEDFDEVFEDDDEDSYSSEFFESIRTSTGLEIGITVTWPGVPPFEISTCLPEDAIAPMFHGTQWAGTRIWRAAVVALQYLLCDECPVKFGPETTLVELGCGLGVPGIILALIHQCQTVLTDKDSLVEQLHQNLQTLSSRNDASCLQAASLDWSAQGVKQLLIQQSSLALATNSRGLFDVVLNCDCIYEPLYGESWKMLAECQEEFLRHNPHAFVLTSVERRRVDGVQHYLQRMQESELVDRVEQVTIPFNAPKEVELYRIFGKGKEAPN